MRAGRPEVGLHGSSRAECVRIVARMNRAGVDRDVRILSDALSGFREAPLVSRYRSISPFRRFLGRRDGGETIVFLERVTARWLRQAGRYILIPNQERFARRLVPLLRHIDHVFCKSEHAREVFARHHGSVHFLGFTSMDRRLSGATPDYGRFLHVAGGSFLKGTSVLLELWARHPEWPVLTVVRRHELRAPERAPGNVEVLTGYRSDEELRELQNACGVHLCPSLSEGWGHSIVEAMSCGAVTVVTDAPPMNELVGPGRGVRVAWFHSEPRKLGTNFYVDPRCLETAIGELIERSDAEKAALGRAARQWFEENDHRFRRNLERLWRAHVVHAATPTRTES